MERPPAGVTGGRQVSRLGGGEPRTGSAGVVCISLALVRLGARSPHALRPRAPNRRHAATPHPASTAHVPDDLPKGVSRTALRPLASEGRVRLRAATPLSGPDLAPTTMTARSQTLTTLDQPRQTSTSVDQSPSQIVHVRQPARHPGGPTTVVGGDEGCHPPLCTTRPTTTGRPARFWWSLSCA